MAHTIHHWDHDTKKRLFGLGVEAMTMSINGRSNTGGPYFTYDNDWINNIDIEDLSEAVEEWTTSYDPSETISNARQYILSKEESINEAVISMLSTARTGQSYWMMI